MTLLSSEAGSMDGAEDDDIEKEILVHLESIDVDADDDASDENDVPTVDDDGEVDNFVDSIWSDINTRTSAFFGQCETHLSSVDEIKSQPYKEHLKKALDERGLKQKEFDEALRAVDDEEGEEVQPEQMPVATEEPERPSQMLRTTGTPYQFENESSISHSGTPRLKAEAEMISEDRNYDGRVTMNPKCRIIEGWLETDEHIEKILEQRWNEYSEHMSTADSAMLLLREQNRSVMEKEIEEEKVKQQKMDSDLRVKEELIMNEHEEDLKKNKTRLANISRQIKEERERLDLLKNQQAEAEEHRRRDAAILIQRFYRGTLVRRIFGEEVKERMALARRKLENEKIIALEKEMKRKKALELERKRKLEENERKEAQKKKKDESETMRSEQSSLVFADAADKSSKKEDIEADQLKVKSKSATTEPSKSQLVDSSTEKAEKKRKSTDIKSKDSVENDVFIDSKPKMKSSDVNNGKSEKTKSDDVIDSKSEKTKSDDVIDSQPDKVNDVSSCSSDRQEKLGAKQSALSETTHSGTVAGLQNKVDKTVDDEKSGKDAKSVVNKTEKLEAKSSNKNANKSEKSDTDVEVKTSDIVEEQGNVKKENIAKEGITKAAAHGTVRNSAKQERKQSEIDKEESKGNVKKLDNANDGKNKTLINGVQVADVESDKEPLADAVAIGNKKKDTSTAQTISVNNLYKKVSYTDDRSNDRHDRKVEAIPAVDPVAVISASSDEPISPSLEGMKRPSEAKTPRSRGKETNSRHDVEPSKGETPRSTNHDGRSFESKISSFGKDQDISCSSPRVSSATKEKSRQVTKDGEARSESSQAVNDAETTKDAARLNGSDEVSGVGSPRLAKSSGCVSCRINQSIPSADVWRRNNQRRFSSRLKHLSSNSVEDPSRSKPPRLPRSVRNCASLTIDQIQKASRKNEEEFSTLKFLSLKEISQPVRVNSLSDFCPQLTVLIIPGCKVVSLEGLETCIALEYVNVKDNQIEFVQFSDHRHLISLDLSCNRLRSIHGLSGTSSLMDLNLSQNRISKISGLQGCPRLQTLNLAHNEVTACDGLSACAFLQILDLSHNHISSLSLDDLPLIRRLNASDNDLAEIPNMTNNPLLQELTLSSNSISDLHNMSTMWLPSLLSLDLRSNSITEIGVLHLPIVRNIFLSTNLLNDLQQVISSLASLHCLEELDIEENPCSTSSGCRAKVIESLKELVIFNGQAVSGRKRPDYVFDDDFVDNCFKMTTEFSSKQVRFEKRLGELFDKDVEGFTHILNCIRRYYNQGEKMAIKHREFHEGIDGKDDDVSSPQANSIVESTGLDVKDDSISLLHTNSIIESTGLDGKDESVSSPPKDTIIESTGLDGKDDMISRPQKNIENNDATIQLLKVVTKVNENPATLHEESPNPKGDDLLKAFERMEVVKPEEFGQMLRGIVLLQALWRGWRTRRMIQQALAYADTNVITSDEEFAQEFAEMNDFNFSDWDEEQLEKLFSSAYRPPPTPNLPPVSARRSLPSVRDEDVKARDPRAGFGKSRNAWGLSPVAPHAPMVPPIIQRPESSHSNTRTETIIDHGEDSFREESIPLSSSRHAKKKDKIMQDWGFKDEKCAAAMFERAKKIKYDPERRAKMSKMSAQQRFMLFKKLESVSKPPLVSAKRHEAPHRQEYFKAMALQQSRADVEEKKEEATRNARTFEWVFNQPVNVEASVNGGSDTRRPDDHRTSRTTNLPRIDRSSRLTGKAEREASSGSSRFSSAGRQGSCELPPIFPRRILPED